ncbi:GNAT family N-acetyltransferase [Litoreibacter roseus]|uniref:Molybdopterin-guanine dinucleotide biosynthesis protein MobC n=1 Tax=Litoreibacter roseus TaxID=2601869 RepID=A0A6N6JIE4_9RHOB|nr:GNAT family N-acetyltransferase [Litoreibacter roseus]GFE65048.1 molybdopterin-guanine dinucleotide biosynthesis protein MobC [Litoreibacter roseus]
MRIERGFDDSQREAVARLFWSAFSGKLSVPLGPEEKACAFLAVVLNPDYALCATNDEGQILGVAGFKTHISGLVGGGLRDLRKVYGGIGALWRGILLDQLERDIARGQLLMDGIFVAPAARGQGVGTALLCALVEYADGERYNDIRLDVIDSNQRARALYERQGFVDSGRIEMGLLRYVFGFSGATTMVRTLP